MKIRKAILAISFIMIFIISFSIRLDLNASYVLDTSTLTSDLEMITDEINKESTIETEENNLINYIYDSDFSDYLKSNFISTVNEAKSAYYSYVNFNDTNDYSKITAFYYGSLLLFQLIGCRLSLELLLISKAGTIGTYIPYYGYTLADNSLICEIAHNNISSGRFPFYNDFFGLNYKNDPFFSIGRFDCRVSGDNIYITDTYDFASNYTEYPKIFNKILNDFGRMMQADYLHKFPVEIRIQHNFSYKYEEVDGDYHLKKCVCGFEKREMHTWSNVSHNQFNPFYDVNKKKCRKCGRIKYVNEM